MSNLIYNGRIDPDYETCATIYKNNDTGDTDNTDEICFKYHYKFHGRGLTTVFAVIKVTMYKRFIVMIEPCDDKQLIVLYDKASNEATVISTMDNLTKMIEYNDHFYTWTQGLENTYYTRYGGHSNNSNELVEKDLDHDAIKKDTLTLLVSSVRKYKPRLVNYGTIIVDRCPAQVSLPKIVSGFWDIMFDF